MKDKFEPMPKRFMVWDKNENRFHSELLPGNKHKIVFDIWEMDWWLDRDLADDNIIVQSTNLFDKDGNEIFEGSIVEDRCSGLNWLVFIENGEVFIRHRGAVMHYGYISTGTKKWVETNVKRIGHILSNPELLEKKDV